MSKKVIQVEGLEIRLISKEDEDYISLTDLAKKINSRSDTLIQNWMRNRNTIEFLGVWEQLHNPDFNPLEFDGIKNQSGLNSFVLTAKQWVIKTGAIGINAKAGRYGGTYAHKDIAFEFCSWLSPVFKLYVLKEFQRLKKEELNQASIEWNVKRTLAKVNYRIHTDAIKTHLIPPSIGKSKTGLFIYANEADLLNHALFGMSAKRWRSINANKDGNIRDHATAEQLLVLANLENLNAEYIREGLKPEVRLKKLNETAIYQMKLLVDYSSVKKLKKGK